MRRLYPTSATTEVNVGSAVGSDVVTAVVGASVSLGSWSSWRLDFYHGTMDGPLNLATEVVFGLKTPVMCLQTYAFFLPICFV